MPVAFSFPLREGVPLLLRDWLLEEASVPSVFSCPGDSMTTPLCLDFWCLLCASVRVKVASHCGHAKPGIECSFVVLWCRLRSASRANCLLHPLILQGQMPVVTSFFFCAAFFFLEVVSFLSSGWRSFADESALTMVFESVKLEPFQCLLMNVVESLKDVAGWQTSAVDERRV